MTITEAQKDAINQALIEKIAIPGVRNEKRQRWLRLLVLTFAKEKGVDIVNAKIEWPSYAPPWTFSDGPTSLLFPVTGNAPKSFPIAGIDTIIPECWSGYDGYRYLIGYSARTNTLAIMSAET